MSVTAGKGSGSGWRLQGNWHGSSAATLPSKAPSAAAAGFTCFSPEIPPPSQPEELPRQHHPSAQASQVQRVLIVEDDPVSHSALRAILSRRGYEITVVETLADGVREIESGQPLHALILDLMLPDGDGETLLHLVRQKQIQSKVIIVTAINDPERVERLRESADLVLRKPIDLAELLRSLGVAGS